MKPVLSKVEGAGSHPVFFVSYFLPVIEFLRVFTLKILDETEGIVNIDITWDIVVWEVSK